MIYFPLMPLEPGEPDELDPKVSMVVREFESPRAYFNWQTQQALLPRSAPRYRMATYAECGEVLHTIYRETKELAHAMKENEDYYDDNEEVFEHTRQFSHASATQRD